MSKTPAVVRRPSPEVGEHTVEVLRELGFEDDEIKQFMENGAVEDTARK
jgi:crotonobetainyl-CoA:carnitine CoA-transferase CaiB-like acyl-CoA transferase